MASEVADTTYFWLSLNPLPFIICRPIAVEELHATTLLPSAYHRSLGPLIYQDAYNYSAPLQNYLTQTYNLNLSYVYDNTIGYDVIPHVGSFKVYLPLSLYTIPLSLSLSHSLAHSLTLMNSKSYHLEDGLTQRSIWQWETQKRMCPTFYFLAHSLETTTLTTSLSLSAHL